ncbi:MAG TPA: type I secretion system permease/ATPase, partial [Desulfobacteraceae bacterium]|nr:type I secretion system permease/ATPase [Desulfobacteraceae bacterium]
SYILYLRLLFDKVMTGRSLETLLYLTLAVIGAYIVSGMLEAVRSKLLVRIGVKYDNNVAGRVFERMIKDSLVPGSAKHTQGLKDVNTIRTFLGGTGIFAIFDTPWVPVYLAVIFLFHPLLGWLACIGGFLLLLLVVAQELATSRMQNRYAQSSLQTDQFLRFVMRNAQAVHAMGMLPALVGHWRDFNRQDVTYEDTMAGRTAGFQNMAKVVMSSTVLAVMATGAYLVIKHEATIGTMVAASMFMGRALAPLMMLGNAWKSWQESRLAYKRLDQLMTEGDTGDLSITLTPVPDEPPPLFRVDNVSHSIGSMPVLQDVSFSLAPGEILAVIGPSGAGKSTLGRIMLGLWRPDEGRVMLDDTPLERFDRTMLGLKVGYVPQEIDLFTGTVAENIARMGKVDSDKVVAAGKETGAHEMILELPHGYDTPIGPGGVTLSGGQQQLIALARARYGEPWLMVLDEPDSHLDNNSRDMFHKLLAELKEKGTLQVVISHKRELAKLADRVLMLDAGRAVELSAAQYQSENNQTQSE